MFLHFTEKSISNSVKLRFFEALCLLTLVYANISQHKLMNNLNSI